MPKSAKLKLRRRTLIKGSAGVVFTLALPSVATPALHSSERVPISPWVHIHPDGTITIFNPVAEMGQGSGTALPLIVAEEMDANWNDVHIEDSPVDSETYGHPAWGIGPIMLTVGSVAVSDYFDSLRIAGAQVRQVLLMEAARRWKVNIDELSTEPSAVVHAGTGRRLSFGALVSTIERPIDVPEVSLNKLKPRSQYRLIGRSVQRFDVPAKTDGSAEFSIDVAPKDVLHATIVRSSVPGASPVVGNSDEVKAMPGVHAIPIVENGIGIIAENYYQVLQAKAALEIEWSGGDALGVDSDVFLRQRAAFLKSSEPSDVVDVTGDVDEQETQRRVDAVYHNEFVYHAQMEPLNAVVAISRDRQNAEVWVGTQVPDRVRRDAARALNLEESQVQVHRCFLGGGFGRRASRDYVIDACQLALHVQRPIKMIWTREEDVNSGRFRPASVQRLSATLDEEGAVATWRHWMAGTGRALISTGARLPHYAIEHRDIRAQSTDIGIRTRSWRAEGHNANKFAIEAFVDELASHTNMDPLDFRRKLIGGDRRARAVLDRVAELARWGESPKEGRALGLSFAERGSITACVVELSLAESRDVIKIHRVWMAVDAGLVVQPDNALAQIEGSVIMAISSTLYEQITIKNGSVQQSNFHDYPILRMDQCPESIDVEFIASDDAPTGIGEAGLPAVGGAIANAFAALTGKRLYYMPFTRERIRQALEES